jgi:hypothetical protein
LYPAGLCVILCSQPIEREEGTVDIVNLSDADYDGGLSTLTRYGTMNVSTARIPRKKRGKGNAALRVDRVNCRGYADTDEGRALASEGIASVKVTYADGTVETRTAGSFRKSGERTRKAKQTTEAKLPEAARLAPITEGQYS